MTVTIPLDEVHRRFLKTELAISVLLNSIVPPTVIWLVRVPPPTSLWGSTSTAASLSKATTFCVFLMTIVLTLVTRARIRENKAPALRLSRGEHPLLKYVPANVLLRALLFSVIACATLLPAALLVAMALHLWPLTRNEFAVLNVIYGGLIGVFMTPLVVLSALSDTDHRCQHGS